MVDGKNCALLKKKENKVRFLKFKKLKKETFLLKNFLLINDKFIEHQSQQLLQLLKI